MATAVLPVWRSPMMSSRWPRPMGIMPSIALRPVWSGSFTGWRATMPGALISIRLRSLELIGPRPSIGWPRAATTAPRSRFPPGPSAMRPARFDLDTPAFLGVDRPAPVDRLAKGIDDPSDQLFSLRHFGDAARAFDRIAFLDHVGFTEQRRADIVFFEVERDAVNFVGKLEQLAGGHLIESVNARDPIARGQHGADFLDLHRFFVVANLFLDDSADLRCADFHT